MIQSISTITAKPPLQMVWLLAAISAGVLAGVLTPVTSLIFIVLITYIILSAITPLASIIIMLTLAPLRVLIATQDSYPLPLDIGQLTFVGLLLSYTIYQVARKQRLWLFDHWSMLHILLAIFILCTGISVFNTISVTSWITESAKWLQILLLVLLIGKQANHWEWVVFALVVSGVANALIGFYEFFGGSGADHLLINDRFFRAFGTFGQPNPFGGFLGLLTPIALMMAWGYLLRWRDWFQQTRAIFNTNLALLFFYTLATLVMMAGILFSWSRGAWIGFILSLAILAFALPRKISQSLILFGVVIGTVALLWFSGRLPASIIDRINNATAEFFAFEDMRGIDITPENYAVAERLAHWQAAGNMIQHSPWLGIGFGAYEVAYADYRLQNWHEPLGHAHNYYLNIWAEGGMISLLGYGLLWLGIVYMTWQIRTHPDNLARSLGVGLLGTWTYLMIHSLLDNLYVNNLFLHLGIMFGIMGVLYNQIRNHLVLRGR